MVWSTFHCCLWVRQEDVKVLLPWLFLEKFLSSFRITEKRVRIKGRDTEKQQIGKNKPTNQQKSRHF